LPEVIADFTRHHDGLVLVTGPPGSGKSTTLAAMIDLYNQEKRGHIVTIEDPIEYVHPDKGCIVSQREVGLDTNKFGDALRAALREAPDLILVGELRDHANLLASGGNRPPGFLDIAHRQRGGIAGTYSFDVPAPRKRPGATAFSENAAWHLISKVSPHNRWQRPALRH
jgi:energy-coupling factor transporter ATP-binding protein EcfA2